MGTETTTKHTCIDVRRQLSPRLLCPFEYNVHSWEICNIESFEQFFLSP